MTIPFVIKRSAFISYCVVSIFSFLLLPCNGFTQGYKISISSESTDKPDKGMFRQKHTTVSTILPAANGGFISLVENKKDGAEYEGAILVLQDAGLNIVKEKDMFEGIKSANIFGLVKIGDRICFLYATSKKDMYSVYSQEISNSMEMVGVPVLLVEFEKMGDHEFSQFETTYSADSSKILLFCPRSVFKTSKKTIDMIVLGGTMTKLYNIRYVFDKSYEGVQMGRYLLGNDGTICMTSLVNRKNHLSRAYEKENGTKIPAYDLRFVKIDEKSAQEMILPSNGMFIETLHILQEKSGYINIAGVYKQDYDENPYGTYRLRFLSTDKDIKFKTFPFPSGLSSQFEKDAKLSIYNGTISSRQYRPSKIIADGEALYLFEQYYTVPDVVMGTYFPNIYRDILFCGMLPNDTVRYSLIKKEKQKDIPAFSGNQVSFYLDGEVFKLWYNAVDEEAAEKKRGLFITAIDKYGSVLSTDMIVDKKQMDGFVIAISKADRYGKGFITTAFKNEKGYLCRIIPGE
jgi:hypothetical protein